MQRWGLGDVRLVEFPDGAAFAEKKPRPRNIVIDVGEGGDELLVIQGHKDKVLPDGYPKNFHRNPDELTEDANDPDICYADGAFDMLGGLAGALQALLRLRLWARRRMRLLIVTGEESQSQGAHAAIHRSNDLLDGASCLASVEIPVGSSLQDEPALYIGRPGRVGLRIRIHGPAMHSGKFRRKDYGQIASTREAMVRQRLGEIFFPEHPNDPLQLMTESLCVPDEAHSRKPGSLTVISEYGFDINVFYSHPGLSPTEIQAIVHKKIRDILGDDNFTVTFQEGRRTPFIPPYLEMEHHPYVQNALDVTAKIHGKRLRLKAARGVADESIFVHAKHCPCVIYPPEGEGEHTRDECVRISSIGRVEQFVRLMAAHEGLLA